MLTRLDKQLPRRVPRNRICDPVLIRWQNIVVDEYRAWQHRRGLHEPHTRIKQAWADRLTYSAPSRLYGLVGRDVVQGCSDERHQQPGVCIWTCVSARLPIVGRSIRRLSVGRRVEGGVGRSIRQRSVGRRVECGAGRSVRRLSVGRRVECGVGRSVRRLRGHGLLLTHDHAYHFPQLGNGRWCVGCGRRVGGCVRHNLGWRVVGLRIRNSVGHRVVRSVGLGLGVVVSRNSVGRSLGRVSARVVVFGALALTFTNVGRRG